MPKQVSLQKMKLSQKSNIFMLFFHKSLQFPFSWNFLRNFLLLKKIPWLFLDLEGCCPVHFLNCVNCRLTFCIYFKKSFEIQDDRHFEIQYVTLFWHSVTSWLAHATQQLKVNKFTCLTHFVTLIGLVIHACIGDFAPLSWAQEWKEPRVTFRKHIEIVCNKCVLKETQLTRFLYVQGKSMLLLDLQPSNTRN